MCVAGCLRVQMFALTNAEAEPSFQFYQFVLSDNSVGDERVQEISLLALRRSGCTNPVADNYDVLANDEHSESCQYQSRDNTNQTTSQTPSHGTVRIAGCAAGETPTCRPGVCASRALIGDGTCDDESLPQGFNLNCPSSSFDGGDCSSYDRSCLSEQGVRCSNAGRCQCVGSDSCQCQCDSGFIGDTCQYEAEYTDAPFCYNFNFAQYGCDLSGGCSVECATAIRDFEQAECTDLLKSLGVINMQQSLDQYRYIERCNCVRLRGEQCCNSVYDLFAISADGTLDISDACSSETAGGRATVSLIRNAFEQCENEATIDSAFRDLLCGITYHRYVDDSMDVANITDDTTDSTIYSTGSCRSALENPLCNGTAADSDTTSWCTALGRTIVAHGADPIFCTYSIRSAWSSLHLCASVPAFPSEADIRAVSDVCVHSHEPTCRGLDNAAHDAVSNTVALDNDFSYARRTDQDEVYEYGAPSIYPLEDGESTDSRGRRLPSSELQEKQLQKQQRGLESGTIDMPVFTTSADYWEEHLPSYMSSPLSAGDGNAPAHKGAMIIETSLCHGVGRNATQWHGGFVHPLGLEANSNCFGPGGELTASVTKDVLTVVTTVVAAEPISVSLSGVLSQSARWHDYQWTSESNGNLMAGSGLPSPTGWVADEFIVQATGNSAAWRGFQWCAALKDTFDNSCVYRVGDDGLVDESECLCTSQKSTLAPASHPHSEYRVLRSLRD